MTPTPDWYDADTDDADRYPTRAPLESTADYVRRLTTELAEARAESERLRDLLKARIRLDRALGRA